MGRKIVNAAIRLTPRKTLLQSKSHNVFLLLFRVIEAGSNTNLRDRAGRHSIDSRFWRDCVHTPVKVFLQYACE